MSEALRLAMISLLVVAMSSAAAAKCLSAETVTRLYRDFSWEAVLTRPGVPLFADQSEEILRKYLTARLASALHTDAACKTKRREVCKLDFMPLWGAQDPVAQDLAIAQVSQNEVRVEYLAGSQSKVVLLFRMESSRAGWRIADIVYPEGTSLAKLLSRVAQ